MAADAQEAETSKYEMLETDKSDMEAEYEEKIGQMEERNQQVTPARPSDDRLDCSRKDSSIHQNSISHFVCAVLCAPQQRIGPAESLLLGSTAALQTLESLERQYQQKIFTEQERRDQVCCVCASGMLYVVFVPAVCCGCQLYV